MALDAADIAEDIAEEADKAADPVAVDALAAVPVALAAQIAAVGRFVTPAGTQMLSAYLIVASWSALSQTFATQHVIALMKPASEQMHLGSRLQEFGIALIVQFCAHLGKELKLCAEANAARSAVTTTVSGNMVNSPRI